MAKLDPDKDRLMWEFQAQLLAIVDKARTIEFRMLNSVGETVETITYLDELQNIVVQSTEQFSQLCTLQLRIANAPSSIPPDIIKLAERTLDRASIRIPALQRSTQEIEQEWR
jgi:hypothetical protein